MRGNGRCSQHAQPVCQAYGFGLPYCRAGLTERNHFAITLRKGVLLAVGIQVFLLQGLKQRKPGGIRRGGPLREELRLLAAAGGNKTIGIRCLRHPWQQSGKPYKSDEHAHGVHDVSP